MSRLAKAGVASGDRRYRKILYRSAIAVAVMVLVAVPRFSVAQEELPQINLGERKIPGKKDLGPRAVGVLQMSSKGKTSLVPIVIMINGKFWDASAYKAAPVPMALDPGTVYEAERSGSSQGLFTISAALHSNAVNAPTPWIATGSWVPAGSEKASPKAKADTVPSGIDKSEGPPRLTKNPSAQSSAPGTPPANSAPPSHPPSSSPPSGSDDGPPRLSKPAAQAPPASPPTSQPNSGSQPSSGTESGKTSSSGPATPPSSGQTGSAQGTPTNPQNKPPDAKSSEAKDDDHPRLAPSDSGAAQGNRPVLRRGKPAESFADEDIPGYSKPGVPAPVTPGKAAEPVSPVPVQLIPAISDAGGPEPHSYGFEFLKGEEDQRRQQLIALAKEQVRAYVQARNKAMVAPKAVAPASHHVAAKKAPEPELTNPQMTAFDLWSTNLPVLVFSAQAQMPPPAPGATSEGLQYSLMIVAYPDIYNNLHKLYSGITDKFHLDLTPRLELVDAVDVDGDGRGELLFRETSDLGSGWVIYRATADKLWKMYDSLNPE